MRSKFARSWALLKNGWQVAASEQAVLLFGMAYNSLFIFLFASIWRYTPFAAHKGEQLSFTTMVWYVAVTELVVFSSGQFMLQVRSDVLAQQLTGLMGRPVPYWQIKMLQLLGRGLLNIMGLCLAVFAAAYYITGQWPFTLVSGLAVSVAIFMALLIAVAASFAIGLLDVWGQYARPIYWMWQKCLFVLGGLMLPLSLYPKWLRLAANLTPFPAMIALPATMVLHADTAGFGWILLQQFGWLAVAFLAAISVHNAARKYIGARGD